MIGQRTLGRFVVMVGLLAGCIAEPEGLRPSACEARRLLADKCGRCHGSHPEHGAPFSLASYEELGVTDAKGETRRERAIAAIERGDMPARFIELEPPVAELDEEERETLLRWLREGDDARASCE
jgi:hypothetical protein